MTEQSQFSDCQFLPSVSVSVLVPSPPAGAGRRRADQHRAAQALSPGQVTATSTARSDWKIESACSPLIGPQDSCVRIQKQPLDEPA